MLVRASCNSVGDLLMKSCVIDTLSMLMVACNEQFDFQKGLTCKPFYQIINYVAQQINLVPQAILDEAEENDLEPMSQD